MTAEEEAVRRHIDSIAGKVEVLVEELVQLKSALADDDLELMPWLSYRLAVILSRVDHAAAEIVIQQARRLEVAGQIPAFPELEPTADVDELLEASS